MRGLIGGKRSGPGQRSLHRHALAWILPVTAFFLWWGYNPAGDVILFINGDCGAVHPWSLLAMQWGGPFVTSRGWSYSVAMDAFGIIQLIVYLAVVLDGLGRPTFRRRLLGLATYHLLGIGLLIACTGDRFF